MEFVVMDVFIVFRDHVFASLAPNQIPLAMRNMNVKILMRDVSATDDKTRDVGDHFQYTMQHSTK